MPQKIIDDFAQQNSFSPRPAAGKGLWVLFLLPVSVIVSSLKHSVTLTPTYKLAAVASCALLGNSAYILVKSLKNEKLQIWHKWPTLVALFTGYLLNILLHTGWWFGILSALFVSFGFLKVYTALLMHLKESFTVGEAGLIAQGVTLFLYSTVNNILNPGFAKTNMQIATLIIQVGLLGIGNLALTVYILNLRSVKSFYIATVIVLTISIILPLHLLLDQSPLLWIFRQVFEDTTLLKLFFYWICCTSLAILAVIYQVSNAKKASTSTRKIFHILAILVYVPGLYFRCSFLYMASGVVLGVFFALEILRLKKVPPMGQTLEEGYILFKDDKDTGLLALTPIYLLVGVSLPLWLHPAPCDVTDSAQLNMLPLLSGLISIGVGDTAASYVGSKFGRFKWKGSSKTIEGTVACVLSQLGALFLIHYTGILTDITTDVVLRLVLATVVGSLVEAKTSQIDNLVLPVIVYIFLC